MEKVIKKFEDCFSIEGYQRAILIDTNRTAFQAIPISLSAFLKNIDGKSKEDIYSYYSNQNTEIIHEYFNFLTNNEFIFETDNLLFDRFTSIPLLWKSPSILTNIIIDFSDCLDIQFIINTLNCFNCSNIELRIKNSFKTENLIKTLELFNNSAVSSIYLTVSSDFYDTIKTFAFNEYLKIESVLIFSYNAEKNEAENLFIKHTHLNLNQIIKIKNIKQFTPNLQLFTESQTHHTYFNRKMYIGAKGEIKNAPECEEEFGNINDLGSVEDLKQIIAIPEFQKYWFVHKELCDVCKDCEFRHMCVDNRLPYQRKDGSWYHKTECNYNPYICKWKDEEGYLTLEECGVVSNEKGFSINHEKITAINKTLWEEETENA